MARDQKTVNVNGTDFLLTQFGTLRGLKYKKKLTKLLAPMLAEEADMLTDEAPSKRWSRMVKKVGENIDNYDEYFIKEFITTGATLGGMNISDQGFDDIFAGDYDKLNGLFNEILNFNYKSVFHVVDFLGQEEPLEEEPLENPEAE